MPEIIVDRGTCAGHARCNAFAPDVFELDDDGYSAISRREVSDEQAIAARAAAEACPERAIVVR